MIYKYSKIGVLGTRQITCEESDLRADFMLGQITRPVFDKRYAKLKKAGLIRRSGWVMK